MDARNLGRSERAEFESILNDKLEQPHLRDLARNPMQLTILLSLIHTRGADLPDKRTSLYDAYVDLFFSREASKNAVVRSNVDLLKDIHRYLAWVLHSDAEVNRRRASGRISAGDLRSLLQSYLARERHNTAVIADIFDVLINRIVMIVSRVQGTYEFEVQPLREYFAARYLYDTAPYSPPGNECKGTKPDRFEAMARNFYWLNVTRFFCGCFSKGELLDLGARVKDLSDDPMLGQTRYPTLLCAMLLSDWVFFQAPRAAADLISMLSSFESFRRLLSTDLYYRPDQNLQIPLQCGGAQLVEKAFSILKELNTRSDVAMRLMEFINANAPADFVEKRWLISSTVMADRLERWLWIGHRIGSLATASQGEIIEILGREALSVNLLSLLVEAGRYDCVAETATNDEAVIGLMLDTPMLFRIQGGHRPPVYLLPSVISATSFLIIKRHLFSHEGMVNIVKSFKEGSCDANVKKAGHSSELEKIAHLISSKFVQLFESRDEVELAAGIEEIVEKLRGQFGDCSAIAALACSIAHWPGGTRGRRKAVKLDDKNLSLCRRMRFARARATQSEWWADQMKSANTTEGRFIAHLCFWKYATLSAVLESTEAVGGALEALETREWNTLLDFLPYILHRHHYGTSREKTPSRLPARLSSKRFALLLGMRERALFGREIFLKFFVKKGDGSKASSEFRQSQALEAALLGELDWDTGLEVIRSTYAEDLSSGVNRTLPRFAANNALPDHVSKQILGSASVYPSRLWDVAEEVAAGQARKAVKPVGTTAKKDRWFEATAASRPRSDRQ